MRVLDLIGTVNVLPDRAAPGLRHATPDTLRLDKAKYAVEDMGGPRTNLRRVRARSAGYKRCTMSQPIGSSNDRCSEYERHHGRCQLVTRISAAVDVTPTPPRRLHLA